MEQSHKKFSIGVRLLALALAVFLIVLDQLLKLAVRRSMLPLQNKPLLPGLLRLHYTQNTGISFSMLANVPAAMWVVSVATGLVMLFGVALILSGRLRQWPALCAAVFIVAGGTGNLLDRLARGFVTDYLEFMFVQFAVFNLADVFISCAVGVLVVWLVWEEWRTRKRARAKKP
jgi:signal peptidase II